MVFDMRLLQFWLASEQKDTPGTGFRRNLRWSLASSYERVPVEYLRFFRYASLRKDSSLSAPTIKEQPPLTNLLLETYFVSNTYVEHLATQRSLRVYSHLQDSRTLHTKILPEAMAYQFGAPTEKWSTTLNDENTYSPPHNRNGQKQR